MNKKFKNTLYQHAGYNQKQADNNYNGGNKLYELFKGAQLEEKNKKCFEYTIDLLNPIKTKSQCIVDIFNYNIVEFSKYSSSPHFKKICD